MPPTSTTDSAPPKQYDIFISYARADGPVVDPVWRALKKLNLHVFDTSRDPTSVWGEDLELAVPARILQRSRGAMVFLSGHYAESTWCEKELEAILGSVKDAAGSFCFLPVRLDDAPLPDALRSLLYLDLRQSSAEEIASSAKKRLDQLEADEQGALDATSDEKLLSRVADQRDPDAFRALYERFAPGLYAFARRGLPEAGDAEDVVQEAFMRCWTRAGSFGPSRARLKTYLFMTARNLVVDRLRRRKRQEAGFKGDVTLETTRSGLESTEEVERLQWALQKLPESQRRVVELHLAGRTFHDIAQLMELPLGTVRLRYHRALQQVRGSLAADRED